VRIHFKMGDKESRPYAYKAPLVPPIASSVTCAIVIIEPMRSSPEILPSASSFKTAKIHTNYSLVREQVKEKICDLLRQPANIQVAHVNHRVRQFGIYTPSS
jgi:hypothetical protein